MQTLETMLAGVASEAFSRVAPLVANRSLADLRPVLDAVETMAKAHLDAAFPPPAMACGAGCAHCCRTEPLGTPLEAVLMAQAIRRHDDAEAVRRDLGRPPPEPGPVPPPCALLDAEERCRAYADRPQICRGFNSLDAGPCRSRLTVGTADIPGYAPPMQLAGAITQALHHATVRAGMQGGVIAILPALARLLDEPDLEQRWCAGEAVFETVSG